MRRVVLFLKGICMGIADVIPGVSGGTLALILGVYRELVDTIRGLNLRWLRPLWAWLRTRSPEAKRALMHELGRMNLPFLAVLGAGIVTALGIGSVIIPTLMENYPVVMRALFFGLIVASVWVPFRMIPKGGAKMWTAAGIAAAVGLVAGYLVTNPGQSIESSRTMFTVESEGETLKDVMRRGPSAWPSERVFWAEENQALRDAVRDASPETFERLSGLHAAATDAAGSKDDLKARSAPYDEVVVPEGTPVDVPRPELWFVFVAGAIAICAMILPGISGSYILLILNAYFFMLNALKGFIKTLASGGIPSSQAAFVILFCLGAGIGLLSFARLLSYLLKQHTAPTLGVLVGLMVGCLRGIWPFRETVDGVVGNTLPSAFDGTVMAAIGACLAGVVVVGVFTWIGRVKEEAEAVEAPE